MDLYVRDEDGEVNMNPTCLDCEYSYIDDIFHELHCKKDRCTKETD